ALRVRVSRDCCIPETGAGRAVSDSLFFFQAEDGIRDPLVTGVQTCALPIPLRVEVDEEARAHLIAVSNGDARIALNTLEVAAMTTPPEASGARVITVQIVEEVAQRRALIYDREGDSHYDHISAFIKSMRGSDPDAAVYWLMRMLAAGEDARYIARRMVVHAAEDVGLADPMALV